MKMQPALHILSGFLLEQQDGQLEPAQNDVSGKPLFAAERLLAAQILARSGTRFLCVGCSAQTKYLTTILPGKHFAVSDPDAFAPNTMGNVEQARGVIDDLKNTVALLNLYHTYRWHEWAGVKCLPAEAVLVANQVLRPETLSQVFGVGEVANVLVSITLDSAARIAAGGNGCMTGRELRMFDDIIKELPPSCGTGPARERVPRYLRQLFAGEYCERLLDELVGVGDIRAETYLSFRPEPEILFGDRKAA